MANTVYNKFQPIWTSTQNISVSTASATNFAAFTGTCTNMTAVRIAAGGAALWVNVFGSATAGGNGCLYLPANTAEYFEFAAGTPISIKADSSANPMIANAVPCV